MKTKIGKKVIGVTLSFLMAICCISVFVANAAPNATVIRRLNGQISCAELAEALEGDFGTYRYNQYDRESYVDAVYTRFPDNGNKIIDNFEDDIIYNFLYKSTSSAEFVEKGYYKFQTYYNVNVVVDSALPSDAKVSVGQDDITSSKVYDIDKNDNLTIKLSKVQGYVAQVKDGNGMWQTVEDNRYVHTAVKSTDLSVRYVQSSQLGDYKINVSVNNASLGEYTGISSDRVDGGHRFNLKVTPYNEATSDFDFDVYVKSVKINGTELNGTYSKTVFTSTTFTVNSDVDVEIIFEKRLALKEGTIEYKKYGPSGNNDIYMLYPAARNGYLPVSEQVGEIENSIINEVVDIENTAGFDRNNVKVDVKGNFLIIGDQYNELSFNIFNLNWGDRTFDNEDDIDEWEEIRITLNATNRYPQVVTKDITVLPVESRYQLEINGTSELLRTSNVDGISNQIRAKVRSKIIAENAKYGITEDDLLNSGIIYNFTVPDFKSLSMTEPKNVEVSVVIPDSEYFLESTGTITVPVVYTVSQMMFNFNLNAADNGVLHYYDGLYTTSSELCEAIENVVGYEIIPEDEESPELPEGTLYVEYLARAKSDDLTEEWFTPGTKFEVPETLDPENPGYYGCHMFGNSKEIIRYRFVYEDDSELISNSVELEVKDLRKDTKIIVNNNLTFEYGDYASKTVEELESTFVEGVYTVINDEINNLIVNAELEFSPALDQLKTGEQVEVTVEFPGDKYSYKPATAKFRVTINGLPVESVNVSSHVMRYEENLEYDFTVSTEPANLKTMNYVVGLRLGGDKVGFEFSILEPSTLAKDIVDAIRANKNITEGQEYQPTFMDLMYVLEGENPVLSQDIFMNMFMPMLLFVQSGSELIVNMPVYIDNQLPTDAGVYFTGAMVTEENYEQKSAMGYLVIAPHHTPVSLEWANELTNGLATPEKIKSEDNYLTSVVTGATVNSTNNLAGKPIDFFISNDTVFITSESVPVLEEGKQPQSNIINPKDLPYGSYTQISILLPAGNVTYSSLPLIRDVVVADKAVQVQIQNADGEAIEPLTIIPLSDSDKIKAIVTDSEGNQINDTDNLNLYYNSVILPYGGSVSINREGITSVVAEYRYIDENNQVVAGRASTVVMFTGDELYSVRDTEVAYDGVGHSPDTVNAGLEKGMFSLIIDQTNKKLNFLLPEELDQLTEFIAIEGENSQYYEIYAARSNLEDVDRVGEEIRKLGLEDIAKITGYSCEINGELPKDAGEYKVFAAAYDKDSFTEIVYNTSSATLVIEKLPITVIAQDQIVKKHESLDLTAFIVEGELANGQTVSITYPDVDTEIVGDFSLVPVVTVKDADGNDVTKNYDITVVQGALTVECITHEFDDGVVSTAPTCTEKGEKIVTCTVCGEPEPREIPELGHDMITDKAVESTCTETGLTEGSHCSRCDEMTTAQEIVPELGHNMITDDAVEPTCTETGLTEGSHCSRCDEATTKQEVILELGHDMITDEAVESTCTETGLTEGSHCSRCDEATTKQEVIPELGHDMITDETVEPTCTETGLTEGSHCSRCDEATTKQETIPALGHTPEYVVEENYIAPTCTEDGSKQMVVYCAVCDVELERKPEIIPALGHTPEDAVEENYVAPTCTEDGSKEMVVYCAVCDVELERKPETIPALGHTPEDAVEENYVAPTCTEDGSKENVVYCAACGVELSRESEIIEAAGHKDEDNDGYCDNCNEKLCNHKCHKRGIIGFFWKIIRFFYRLINIQQYCDCGNLHYEKPIINFNW